MRLLLVCVLAACGSAPPQPATPTPHPQPPAQPQPPPQQQPAPPTSGGPEDALVHGHPTPEDFDAIVASFPTLSADRRASIAAIGTSENAPIRVPSIGYEYVWVAKIACNGSQGQVEEQSLLDTKTGQLDELEFTCPGDGSKHSTYFDFSADPTEQAMKKELGGGD